MLSKLSDRFPINDSVKLHQILDPDTKNLIARAEASALLETAMQFAIDRGYISLVTRSNLNSSVQSVQHNVGDSDADESELKRRRMKMELLEEMRNEAQPGHDVTNEVGTSIK